MLFRSPVGVDSVGGARSIALRTMLVACKMAIEDVQQVALSSNVGAAMVAGQIKFGVLHIDDIPVIEIEFGPSDEAKALSDVPFRLTSSFLFAPMWNTKSTDDPVNRLLPLNWAAVAMRSTSDNN